MTPTHEAPVHPDPDANARFVLGNIAANGRAFVACVVAIDVAFYLATRQQAFAVLALMPLVGLGAAVAADRSKLGPVRTAMSVSATAWPAAALFGTFLKVIL